MLCFSLFENLKYQLQYDVQCFKTNLPVGVGSLLNMDRRVAWDSFLTMLGGTLNKFTLNFHSHFYKARGGLAGRIQRGGSSGEGPAGRVQRGGSSGEGPAGRVQRGRSSGEGPAFHIRAYGSNVKRCP